MIKVLIILYATAMTYVSYVTTDGDVKVTYQIIRDGIVEVVSGIRDSM